MSEQSQMHLHKNKKISRQAYVEFQLTQHQFHSDREQTNHAIDTLPYSNNLNLSRDEFPSFTIEFHINNPIQQLKIEFKQRLRKKGFKCVQIFQNQLYLVRMTLSDKLKKLFLCKQPLKYMLTIRTHQFRSVRTISLKQVVSPGGSSSSSQKQVDQILTYLSQSIKLNKVLTCQQLNQLDSQYKQDVYSLDATSNYMFSKMLVDVNYSVGKRILIIINKFKQHQSHQSFKLNQMTWLNQAVAEITQEMLQGFNCSRKQLYEILGYCRKSIQYFIYSSIQQYHAQINTKLYYNNTNNISKQIKFNKNYYTSLKHLNNLLKSQISIEIYQNLFLLSQFIKIETIIKEVQQVEKQQFLDWIKKTHLQNILIKMKSLKAAGFKDQFYQRFIKDFKFQE